MQDCALKSTHKRDKHTNFQEGGKRSVIEMHRSKDKIRQTWKAEWQHFIFVMNTFLLHYP